MRRLLAIFATFLASCTGNLSHSQTPGANKTPTEQDPFDKHSENIGGDTDNAYERLIVQLEQVIDPDKLNLDDIDAVQKEVITDQALKHAAVEIKNLKSLLVRDQVANYPDMNRAVAETRANNEVNQLVSDVWDFVFDTAN